MLASLASAIWLAFSAASLRADPTPAWLFTDGAVLQRGQPVPVWGRAESGEAITVIIATPTGKAVASAKTIADRDSAWQVRLPAMQAGGPFTLTIAGKKTITLTDILIGDVWLCSGQSNMEWRLGELQNSAQAIATAAIPGLRFLTVPRNTQARLARLGQARTSEPAHWVASDSATASAFSATAFYFGRQLRQDEHVPIGLINASVGGTMVELWTPESELRQLPSLPPMLMQLDSAVAAFPKQFEAYRAALDQWYDIRQRAKPGDSVPPQPQPVWDPLQTRGYGPAMLYNGMIAPLVPYGIRGVVWYQGESNAPQQPESYQSLLEGMIHSWRTVWRQTNLPFLIVQLPNLNESVQSRGDWAALREAQWKVVNAVPNTGLIVTIDIGGDLHPPDKLTVGQRLSRLARATVYHEKNISFMGPVYHGMRVEGNTIRLHFTTNGNALIAKGTALSGFLIAGADHRFVPGTARIDGADVIVSSPDIAAPVAVRYAWENDPPVTLYNDNGLPAMPFRTDNWPLESAPSK